MNRKLVTTGLLAGLVAGAGAGLILESSGFAGASGAPASVAAVTDDTTDTGDTGDTGSADTSAADDSDRPEPGERLTEVLQPLVDDGTITADQLTAIVETLRAAGPPMGGPGHGHHGPAFGLDAAAAALGITADELRTALAGGSTIAEVAAAEGVEVQSVIDALVAEATERISARVADGSLTQEEADARLAEVTTRITDVVNNGRPEGGPGHMPPSDDDN